MKVLVAYTSQTGNTQKIAEAIYQQIECEKELKKVDEVKSLAGYDLAFLGFPVHGGGPDKKARNFLGKQTPGAKVALFITHAASEGSEEAQGYLAKFRDAATGATLVGTFDCRGQLGSSVRLLMSVLPDPKLRLAAKDHSDEGQPDATRIEQARAFARETMQKVSAG